MLLVFWDWKSCYLSSGNENRMLNQRLEIACEKKKKYLLMILLNQMMINNSNKHNYLDNQEFFVAYLLNQQNA